MENKKFEIDAEITESDFETIMEALNCWEIQCNADLDLIKRLKDLPDPEFPDKETLEQFRAWKNSLLSREPKLKKDGRIRMEKAIMLKAKLLMMNQQQATDKFLDIASGLDEDDEDE